MNEAELDDLLVRYADGTLDANRLARLEAELKRSGSARGRMRELAEQVFAIGEAGRCREARSPRRQIVEFPIASPRRFWRPMLALAAVLTVMLGIVSLMQVRSRGTMIEVIAVRGAAVWIEGEKRVPLVAGTRLPAGTIETENETATAEVQLSDGSHFTLNGSAEAVFTEVGSKQVTLKRGKVTAFVAKQSPGRPLQVRTPTANVEVLGTVFSLDVAPQRTSLSVAEGRVRLRRLVDGREVEVAAEQQVAASLVASDALAPEGLKTPPSQWSLPLTSPPDRVTGSWVPSGAAAPAHLAAVPIVVQQKGDGSVYVHHGVIVHSASNSPADAFASLTPDSALSVRLRMRKGSAIQLMIATRRPDGGFAGNFELSKRHPQIVPGSDWHTLQVPIRDFVPIHPERAQVAAGNIANVVIVTTVHESVGLEVAEISILPAPSGN